MMKPLLFAAVAGLGLVSAGPPGPDEERTGYPPCSARVTDQCIQLYERGVRTRENLAQNRHRERRRAETEIAERDAPAPAYGGARHYPPCSAAVKDECRQRRALARRIRIAGERG